MCIYSIVIAIKDSYELNLAREITLKSFFKTQGTIYLRLTLSSIYFVLLTDSIDRFIRRLWIIEISDPTVFAGSARCQAKQQCQYAHVNRAVNGVSGGDHPRRYEYDVLRSSRSSNVDTVVILGFYRGGDASYRHCFSMSLSASLSVPARKDVGWHPRGANLDHRGETIRFHLTRDRLSYIRNEVPGFRRSAASWDTRVPTRTEMTSIFVVVARGAGRFH